MKGNGATMRRMYIQSEVVQAPLERDQQRVGKFSGIKRRLETFNSFLNLNSVA
jgi:hypothetical protein